jgi:hypothetical protein
VGARFDCASFSPSIFNTIVRYGVSIAPTRFGTNRPFSAHKVLMSQISPFDDSGRASHLGCSPVFFCTVSAAHRAGKAALKQLMAETFPNRIPSLRMDA